MSPKYGDKHFNINPMLFLFCLCFLSLLQEKNKKIGRDLEDEDLV
jgi:hypothetical protein